MATNLSETDLVIKAISSDTRREILTQLCTGEMTIKEIASKNDITKQAASKHVNILQNSGLINERKSGRKKYCSFNPAPLKRVREYIEELEVFWDERLLKLKQNIESEK